MDSPDEYYITAGCTDGKTYVWDLRMPVNIMHVLQHGGQFGPSYLPQAPMISSTLTVID